MEMVAGTQNPLSSQDEFTQMLRGEISHSNLHLVEWHSTEWRFEWCSLQSALNRTQGWHLGEIDWQQAC